MIKNTTPLKKLSPTFALGFLLVVILFATLLLTNSWRFAIPPETNRYQNDWPSANQNLSNTRSTKNSSISVANAKSLGVSWTLPIQGVSEWGAASTNPLILGDTLYFQDLKSNIYAVSYTTGKQIWMKEYNENSAGPSGVAIGYGRIFAAKGHHDVIALDLNGNEMWKVTITTNENVGIDIQPIVYDGLVYVSTVPGVSNSNFYKGGATGVVYALDAKNGKIVWSFNTVDSDNIWGNAEVNSGGGAWYPPAVDPKEETMYWGIGNPAPWPGTKDFPNGTSRPGLNLYTNSLVALSTATGKLQWYNQVLPHDLFDYDFQISPILATLNRDGKMSNIIIGAGKMGKVFAFDKQSGRILWKTNVGSHLNDELTALPKGSTKVSPGPLGGVETCMAYADGIIYVPVVNMTVEYTSTEFVAKSFNLPAGMGELVALDAATGKILWTNKLDSINVGAATVVNDTVFTSTLNGKIYAFNRITGEKLLEYQAPGGINGWPAVKDDSIVFPVGLGPNPVLLSLKIGINSLSPTSTAIPVGGTEKKFQQ